MIAEHQPKVFNNLPVRAAVSSQADGLMSFGVNPSEQKHLTVRHNRIRWLAQLGLPLEQTTLLRLTYGSDITYTRMLDVDETAAGKGMSQPNDVLIADAMFTQTKNLGLFLPLADCGGVVLYDQQNQALGMLHLGRHATFDNLAAKAVAHMQQKYNTNPQNILAWVSPSISGDSYWLHRFNFANDPAWQPFSRQQGEGWLVDLQGYNIDQFKKAGVPAAHIEYAQIDTATHAEYPSHYRYQTHGEAHKVGRFAIVAWLTP